MYPKNFCTSTLSPSDPAYFLSSTALNKPAANNKARDFQNNQVKWITVVFKFTYHPILPVNKPHDTAEKRSKMSPMIECLLALGQTRHGFKKLKQD